MDLIHLGPVQLVVQVQQHRATLHGVKLLGKIVNGKIAHCSSQWGLVKVN